MPTARLQASTAGILDILIRRISWSKSVLSTDSLGRAQATTFPALSFQTLPSSVLFHPNGSILALLAFLPSPILSGRPSNMVRSPVGPLSSILICAKPIRRANHSTMLSGSFEAKTSAILPRLASITLATWGSSAMPSSNTGDST